MIKKKYFVYAGETGGSSMMTTEEKAGQIIKDIQKEAGTNPVRIFRNIASKEYVSIHGPEHHVLDAKYGKNSAN